MSTIKQQLGDWGERLVAKLCACPKCKQHSTLKRLPANFKCADLICDFCGYLAQVKATAAKSILPLPKSIPGAAWGPQKKRMDAGIYFPLFLAIKSPKETAIFYLPTDFQNAALFHPRTPLSARAQKAGWTGFRYSLSNLEHGALVRIF